MKTTRPASTPTAAADWRAAAAEAKAGEELIRSAPETLPAPGGSPTARPESTSPASARSAVAGAKGNQRRMRVRNERYRKARSS